MGTNGRRMNPFRSAFRVNNLHKDRKIHEIYRELYGEDFNIKRGYEVESTEYQIRLAKIVLDRCQVLFKEMPVKFIIKIHNGTIYYRGKKSREEVMKKWKLNDVS